MKRVICVLLVCMVTFAGTVCEASNVSRAERVGVTVGRAVGRAMDKVVTTGRAVGGAVRKAITPEEAVAIGVAVGTGVTAGAITYWTIGGSGWAVGGTAFAITLTPYMLIGAGVGITVYGVYHILATN